MSKDYSEIAELFRTSAREGYSLDDQNKHVPQALLDEDFDEPTDLISLTHVFQRNKESRLIFVTQQKILECAGDQLLTKGLKDFSYVARGSSAVCLTSNGKAIRVGISPVKISNRTGLSDVRDSAAINLKRKGLAASKKDTAVIEANADKFGWPKDLTWLLPNGRFKQEAFFPKPDDPLSLVIKL